MFILHRSRVRVKALFLFAAFLLILPTIFPGNSHFPAPKLPDTSTQPSKDFFADLPLQFIKNIEHEPNAAAYPWALVGGGLLLAPGKLIYHLIDPAEAPGSAEMFPEPAKQPTINLEIEWVSANPHSSMSGMDRLPGKVNTFAGEKPSQWHTGLPTYAGVRMRSLYPGIELTFLGREGTLKSQYTIAAHANPTQIRWRYPEGTELKIDAETGDLQVYRENRLLLIEKAPEAWQMVDGMREAVQVSYKITNNEASFAIGRYDPKVELVIDPVVEFSTYIGSGTYSFGRDVAVDADGFIYITGTTPDNKFYISKIDQTARTFVYTALIGSNLAGIVNGLAVDASKNVYITGEISSETFPTQNPLQAKCSLSDAFVTKLKPDGSGLLFSTFLCGSNYDSGNAIVVDAEQRAYVVGYTMSSDFPATAGAFDQTLGGNSDGFLAVLDTLQPAALKVTYLGGSQKENLTDIHLGEPNSLYLLGYSNSNDYPVLNPITSFHGGFCWYDTCSDAVLTKMNWAEGSMIYSTYLGGTGSDLGTNMDVDNGGNVYLVGGTNSNDLPLVNPIQTRNNQGRTDSEGELFVMIVNAFGNNLLYSTYLGGPGDDQGGMISLLDSTNSFVITGSTYKCFPPYSFVQLDQSVNFLLLFDPTGFPTYFRFISGLVNGNPKGMAVDDQRSLYVIGNTWATNFPLINPYSTTVSSTYLVKLAQSPPYQPKPNDIFLPLVMNSSLGIFGWVTQSGCGVGGISLELRYYDGYSWTTRATTTTREDGRYSFPNLPSLQPGEFYYVRYLNTSNPDRLWTWGTPILWKYQSGQNVLLSIFDITKLYLLYPADGTEINLPYTFQWGPRQVTPDDSYDLNLVEYFGDDYWYTSPLGFVSTYTLNSKPDGFNIGEPQFWYVGIHSPDGGYGESYDSYLFFFNNIGNSSITGQFIPEAARKERLEQIEARRLKEVEEKQHTP